MLHLKTHLSAAAAWEMQTQFLALNKGISGLEDETRTRTQSWCRVLRRGVGPALRARPTLIRAVRNCMSRCSPPLAQSAGTTTEATHYEPGQRHRLRATCVLPVRALIGRVRSDPCAGLLLVSHRIALGTQARWEASVPELERTLSHAHAHSRTRTLTRLHREMGDQDVA